MHTDRQVLLQPGTAMERAHRYIVHYISTSKHAVRPLMLCVVQQALAVNINTHSQMH